MNANEAYEKLVEFLKPELTKKCQLVGGNYLEDDDIFVFFTFNDSIDSSEKCIDWSVNKHTGEIQEFDPSPEERKIFKSKSKKGMVS